MPNWLTTFFGPAPKVEAEASKAVTRAEQLYRDIPSANVLMSSNSFTEGFNDVPLVPNPPAAAVQSSIVGSTVSNLVKIAGTFGSSIDDLVAKIDLIEEELRQKRAARGAAVNALSSLIDDKALTDDEKTAISLEMNDHADDLGAAAMRSQPTPENEPAPMPAAPAPVFPQTTGQVLTPGPRTDPTAGAAL